MHDALVAQLKSQIAQQSKELVSKSNEHELQLNQLLHAKSEALS
jgi:hypothetical protein